MCAVTRLKYKPVFKEGVRGNTGTSGHAGAWALGHAKSQIAPAACSPQSQSCFVLQQKGTVWLLIENIQGETTIP